MMSKHDQVDARLDDLDEARLKPPGEHDRSAALSVRIGTRTNWGQLALGYGL
jgi:hypothetical protein